MLFWQISGSLKGTAAEGKVSQADLIALAGAYAVEICGGPVIRVPVGRVDAVGADPGGRMVSERAGVEALKSNFAGKGLNTQEMVVLSGAHTLGELDSWTVHAVLAFI
jgi:L-ascorbate peroxidase